MDSLENEDVLLIDGHCGTCSKLGSFLNRRISRKTPLKIIAQQEDLGVEIISKLPVEIQNIDSVILIRKGTPYYYSSAGIRCLLYMKLWWKIIYPFAWITPLPIRNITYKTFAKNRHRFFKSKN